MLRSGADRAPRVASRRCWPVSSWRPPAAAQRWRQQHPQSTLAGGLRAARSAKARVAASLAGAAAGAAGALVVAKVALPASPVSRAEAAAPGEPEPGVALLEKASAHIPGIEEYTRAQVAEHVGPDSIWVTYGSAVFDITEFVKQHPGGAKRIMLAAGKDLAPFWRIYQQHFGEGAAETVAGHLARMRIANLVPGDDDDDAESSSVPADDPFAAEPTGRHPSLKVWSKRAFNAEAPADLIGDTWITPNEVFYCRHHHPVPDIDLDDYRLTVTGLGLERELSLSLDNLKTLFPKREIVVTTQCGGNRRSGMNKVKKTMGISWGVGAISTAKWGGVWLRDVLRLAGLDDEERAAELGVKQIHFECVDKPFGVSIGRRKALAHRGDVLLAYEMNGQPLAREHGAPVRVVVPGYLGVRSAKWVDSIVAAAEPIETEWQTGFSYRAFPPNLEELPDDLSPYPPVQELPVQSAMLLPADGDEINDDSYTTWGLDLKGYAWAGGGRKIVRVDVSADNGATWEQAELTSGAEQPSERAWAWVLWEATIEPALLQRLAARAQTSEQPLLDNGSKGAPGRWLTITCKATDEAFNTQVCEKRTFLSHLYIKTIILPRQARDKHRGS
jgi:sulfite oxidase